MLLPSSSDVGLGGVGAGLFGKAGEFGADAESLDGQVLDLSARVIT